MPYEKSVPLEMQDLPLHELLDIDPETLDDNQLQDLIKHIQEKRTSPQKRRSDNVKASDKIRGKRVDILEDFL